MSHWIQMSLMTGEEGVLIPTERTGCSIDRDSSSEGEDMGQDAREGGPERSKKKH